MKKRAMSSKSQSRSLQNLQNNSLDFETIQSAHLKFLFVARCGVFGDALNSRFPRHRQRKEPGLFDGHGDGLEEGGGKEILGGLEKSQKWEGKRYMGIS